MQALVKFREWMTLREVEPSLAHAQFVELQRQIPLLYALLGVNAVAVSHTHFGTAPNWMTVVVPCFLVMLSVVRLVTWLKRRHVVVEPGEAVRFLRRTTVLAALVTLAYITWSLHLARYGDQHQQAHVAIFIAITMIGCIFCLMQLPQAALVVTAVAASPYLVFTFTTRDPVFISIGINIVLVTMVMIRVLLNSFGGFQTLVRTQGETARLNRENTRLAHTDMLTALPNRRLFFASVEALLEARARAGGEVALGVIDLDRFKAANDTFGHALGDRLLEAVGARLREVFGEDHVVARLGGDEFAFAVPQDGEAAMALATAVCRSLAAPFRLGDITVSIGASCGLASTRDVPAAAAALYDGADYALYKAKADRRGFATLYSAEHEQRIRSERAVEAALQVADLQAEMEVHFQPILGVVEGRVLAVEALARWTSPLLGRVGPDVFIPLAERAGIVHRLTLVLLEKALAGLRHLPGAVKLSFNLSANDITCHETVLGIVALIRRSGLEPSRIVMELTETAVLRDFEAAEGSMRLFRALGLNIALDDFGTGHSSLSYLRRLPIDKVKIDRSFMADASDTGGRELLAAVVAFCRSMRMECIAEGVEEEAQLAFLRDIGCDAFQGYLVAKPMPIRDYLAWQTSRGRALAAPAPARV